MHGSSVGGWINRSSCNDQGTIRVQTGRWRTVESHWAGDVAGLEREVELLTYMCRWESQPPPPADAMRSSTHEIQHKLKSRFPASWRDGISVIVVASPIRVAVASPNTTPMATTRDMHTALPAAHLERSHLVLLQRQRAHQHGGLGALGGSPGGLLPQGCRGKGGGGGREVGWGGEAGWKLDRGWGAWSPGGAPRGLLPKGWGGREGRREGERERGDWVEAR